LKDINPIERNQRPRDPCATDSYYYNGKTNFTISGKKCEIWAEIEDAKNYFPIGVNPPNHNFCRNPNKDGKGAWCLAKYESFNVIEGYKLYYKALIFQKFSGKVTKKNYRKFKRKFK